MNKIIKLTILLFLSLQVFFIYQATKENTIKLLAIGDGLSLGINSYGIENYGYIDYYKDYLKENHQQVEVINNSTKDLSISNLLTILKNTPEIKRDLTEAHILILTIGYNDLIYQLSLDENLNDNELNHITNIINNNYQQLITEIRKYYKEKIIVVGYFKSNKDNYYLNKGIRNLNNILKSNDEITYIDTYNLLNNRKKYFSNPTSYYPNNEAYKAISNKIISKTLEK